MDNVDCQNSIAAQQDYACETIIEANKTFMSLCQGVTVSGDISNVTEDVICSNDKIIVLLSSLHPR